MTNNLPLVGLNLALSLGNPTKKEMPRAEEQMCYINTLRPEISVPRTNYPEGNHVLEKLTYLMICNCPPYQEVVL
jgi:hypothetical protein